MNVDVSTRQYKFAHGKLPRGVGNWAFAFAGRPRLIVWVSGPYGQAKRTAVAEAKKLNVQLLEVCS
jgi:hypothetical protein